MGGAGLVPCEDFLVERTFACVLVDRASFCISEGWCHVQQYVLGCLCIWYGFGQTVC